jgi:Predicted membrane protein (DUF2085)
MDEKLSDVQTALRYAALVARSGRFAAVALLVLGVIAGVAVPLAACARESASPLLATSIRVGYAMGHLVCHQRADRSFFSCGQQWPVCGRCAGLYMGFACGGLVGLAAIGAGASRREVPDTTRRWRLALVGAALPTAVLWLMEFGLGLNPGSLIRWAGALPLGVTTALWLAAVGRGHLR